MGLKAGGIIIFLFIQLLVVDLFLINHGVEGMRSISIDEEDIELERQLKVLNKPPIKTFHTEWGYIVDCVDIYKQPAFDHPLLKNHKIQMKPHFPEELEKRETLRGNETNISHIMSQGIKCPDGTVPIRRTQKEDLIRAKSFSMSRNAANDHRLATLRLEHQGQRFFGSSAVMNIYNPAVAADQFSRAQIWVMSGHTQTTEHDAIQAGWINLSSISTAHSNVDCIFVLEVSNAIGGDSTASNKKQMISKVDMHYSPLRSSLGINCPSLKLPMLSEHDSNVAFSFSLYDRAPCTVSRQLYNDDRTHLFTYWTGDGYQHTGCFDTLCAGFLQVDNQIYPGIAAAPTSTFGGDQYELDFMIYQDRESSNWWLHISGKQVGYWPVSLFPYMNYGAEVVRWGGHVKAGANGISPPMGSGHIPDTCYFHHVQYVNGFAELVDLNSDMNLTSNVDCSLYSLTLLGNRNPYGYSFLFGGPGGEC